MDRAQIFGTFNYTAREFSTPEERQAKAIERVKQIGGGHSLITCANCKASLVPINNINLERIGILWKDEIDKIFLLEFKEACAYCAIFNKPELISKIPV